MKKVILTIAVVLAAATVNAQLEVKAKTTSEVVWTATKLSSVPKIVKILNETDSIYTLFYRDAQYTQIVEIEYISFNNVEEVNQFVEICKQVIESGESVSLTLNGDDLYIGKMLQRCYIKKNGNSFFYLSDKQLNTINL